MPEIRSTLPTSGEIHKTSKKNQVLTFTNIDNNNKILKTFIDQENEESDRYGNIFPFYFRRPRCR